MRISVGIVISHESQESIERCLESIFNSLNYADQLVEQFEIIVVESSIREQEKIQLPEYVRIIQSASNNLAFNRNLILKEAKYEGIYFTDPDCQLDQVTIKCLVKHFAKYLGQKNKELAENNFFAIAGPNISTSKNTRLQNFFSFMMNAKLLNGGSAQMRVKEGIYSDWHAPTCNILYLRREVNGQYFDEKYFSAGEDLEFNFRNYKKTKNKILIVGDAPVTHFQPEEALKFIHKIFGYGIAQTHLLKSHSSAVSNQRSWLLFATLLLLALSAFLEFSFLLKIIFGAYIVYLSVFLVEAYGQKKLSNIFSLILMHMAVAISYLAGQIFGLFTRRSERVFVEGEKQLLAEE